MREIVAEMLVAEAAKGKSMSPDAYVEAEIARRAKPVTDADVELEPVVAAGEAGIAEARSQIEAFRADPRRGRAARIRPGQVDHPAPGPVDAAVVNTASEAFLVGPPGQPDTNIVLHPPTATPGLTGVFTMSDSTGMLQHAIGNHPAQIAGAGNEDRVGEVEQVVHRPLRGGRRRQVPRV